MVSDLIVEENVKHVYVHSFKKRDVDETKFLDGLHENDNDGEQYTTSDVVAEIEIMENGVFLDFIPEWDLFCFSVQLHFNLKLRFLEKGFKGIKYLKRV